MIFFNPTPFKIEAMAGGKTYYCESLKNVDVWDTDHCRILIKRDHHGTKQGLVHLEFDELLQKKFNNDFEAFKKDQSIIGLKNLHALIKEAWINEKQAEIDIKHHKTGAEADKAIVDPSKFSGKLKLVEKWQAELAASEAPKEEKKVKREYHKKSGSVNEQVAASL